MPIQIDLPGRKALVTGASRGSEFEIASKLAEAGCALEPDALAHGPNLVKALLAPLPQLEIVPVGDVNLDTAAVWSIKNHSN